MERVAARSLTFAKVYTRIIYAKEKFCIQDIKKNKLSLHMQDVPFQRILLEEDWASSGRRIEKVSHVQ